MREDCSSPPILSVTGVVNQTLLRLSRNHQKIYNILCGFIKLSITQSYLHIIDFQFFGTCNIFWCSPASCSLPRSRCRWVCRGDPLTSSKSHRWWSPSGLCRKQRAWNVQIEENLTFFESLCVMLKFSCTMYIEWFTLSWSSTKKHMRHELFSFYSFLLVFNRLE